MYLLSYRSSKASHPWGDKMNGCAVVDKPACPSYAAAKSAKAKNAFAPSMIRTKVTRQEPIQPRFKRLPRCRKLSGKGLSLPPIKMPINNGVHRRAGCPYPAARSAFRFRLEAGCGQPALHDFSISLYNFLPGFICSHEIRAPFGHQSVKITDCFRGDKLLKT